MTCKECQEFLKRLATDCTVAERAATVRHYATCKRCLQKFMRMVKKEGVTPHGTPEYEAAQKGMQEMLADPEAAKMLEGLL